jgi:hypothetical protein
MPARIPQLKEPRVFWFRTNGGYEHHAFEILEDGTIDDESCCGRVDLEWCADEPARELREFDEHPAHSECLAVAELKLPSLS